MEKTKNQLGGKNKYRGTIQVTFKSVLINDADTFEWLSGNKSKVNECVLSRFSLV